MDTPGDRFLNYVKQWLKDFSKTKFAIPTIVALAALVYYVVVTSFSVVCFSNLIPPLLMLGLLMGIGS